MASTYNVQFHFISFCNDIDSPDKHVLPVGYRLALQFADIGFNNEVPVIDRPVLDSTEKGKRKNVRLGVFEMRLYE